MGGVVGGSRDVDGVGVGRPDSDSCSNTSYASSTEGKRGRVFS